MSRVFRASILLAVFFGINKIVALVRQTLIARQFGFSPQIDAFNVANNLPDLLFSLFSGGALAMAFIPVFAEHVEEFGRPSSWKLFSRLANLIFIATLVLSFLIAVFARPLVAWQFGVSPGFPPEQQALVVELMRINLVALILFSISGLVMSSLQALKHFFLTALAPILYNGGVIIGVLIFAPTTPFEVWGIELPALGLGIHGLVYGTILGAVLHLIIQIPGIIFYGFRWSFSLAIRDAGVQKVLRLMGPRIATVFLIQLLFLARDNFASRLPGGSVTALTYGYFIMQVPETLIGTAIGTALLPTLSQFASGGRREEFAAIFNRALRVILASTLFVSVILSITLPYLMEIVFDFKESDQTLLIWTTRGYLVGLLGQCLLEIASRAYYAKQNARLPLIGTALRAGVFFGLSFLLFYSLGAVGLALADSIAISAEVLFLLIILYRSAPSAIASGSTFARAVVGSVVAAGAAWGILSFIPLPQVVLVAAAILGATGIYLLFIRQEIRMAFRL